MISAKYRGHNITFKNDVWVYSKTNQPVYENPFIVCGYCGKPQTKDGHDGCIANLPGVKNACCGHDIISDAYVQFPDGKCVRGSKAIKYFKYLEDIITE